MNRLLQAYKKDILLIALFLAIGLAILVSGLLLTGRGDVAVVRVDGEMIEEYPLGKNATYEIQGYGGGTNLLVIEDGTAKITEASCPDGLCIGMGRIQKNGQSIICLPNRVSVEIQGKNAANEQQPDGVTK